MSIDINILIGILWYLPVLYILAAILLPFFNAKFRTKSFMWRAIGYGILLIILDLFLMIYLISSFGIGL